MRFLHSNHKLLPIYFAQTTFFTKKKSKQILSFLNKTQNGQRYKTLKQNFKTKTKRKF